MLRILFEIIVPLLLPTAVYLLWLRIRRAWHSGERLSWATLPWLGLAASGIVLLAVVLFVAVIGFGTPESGVYVPPRWLNGHIVPGHIEPRPRL